MKACMMLMHQYYVNSIEEHKECTHTYSHPHYKADMKIIHEHYAYNITKII